VLNDPEEMHNLAGNAAKAAVIERLTKKLSQ
jgi:hypothetical protein